MIIVTAGKGSSGKSSIAALLTAALTQSGLGRGLVVDGDPHESLADMLGQVMRGRTLGDLRDRYEKALSHGTGLGNQSRQSFAAELVAREALVPTQGFDLLAMGRWRQPGSQCTVNTLLGRVLDNLLPQYPWVLVDQEAGLEPIGRAEFPIDHLVLVARPDQAFLRVAGLIWTHAHEIGRAIARTHLVLNQSDPEEEAPSLIGTLLDEMAACLYHLPRSSTLAQLSRQGVSPLALPAQDPWRQAVESLPLITEIAHAPAAA
jgi:CO dehydrogenase maturation factor